MKRLPILMACAFLLIFGSCTKVDEAPDIILMMADDLGWGDTGFNGNKEVQTPSMDRMADMGVILSRFYSASPVCSPTRASCLTGRNRYGDDQCKQQAPRCIHFFPPGDYKKSCKSVLVQSLPDNGRPCGLSYVTFI